MARLYGKGTITELVKGKKYYLELSGGKDPITGKYRRHRETFLGTKRQAELRIESIRRELESGKRIDADRITFAAWCEEYLSNREKMGKCRPATLKRDRGLSKHLLHGFGDTLVVDITPSMVNGLYASLRENGVGDTTVRQCHRLLKAILKNAVNNDIIMRNPVERADTPKNPKPMRQSLGIEDANRLGMICASGTPTANKTAVYLGLSLGARIGEVLGIEWQHVELRGDRPFVHICQQYTEERETAPLKTDKDENPVGRIVPIDAPTVAVLKAWKSVQRKQLNELGIDQGGNTPVITNQLGTFTSHTRFQRWWRSFCIENGYGRLVAEDGREIVTLTIGDDAELYDDCVIEWKDAQGWPCDSNGKRFSRSYPKPKIKAKYDGLHFHALRHTHFSMRMASGMDIPTAQALGGWSTPSMLLNVYAHPVAENVWASAGFMDKLASMNKVGKGAF